MKRYPAVVLMLVVIAIAGCDRSPEEQLAYQHAEEQYQINMRNAQQPREAGAPEQDSERSLRGRDSAGS